MRHKVEFLTSNCGEYLHAFDIRSNNLGKYNKASVLKFLSKAQQTKVNKLIDSVVVIIDENVLTNVYKDMQK